MEAELGEYTFLPWIKSGLGAHIIDDVQSLTGPRANLDIPVNIKRYYLDGKVDSVPAPKRIIELMGPGDIVGMVKDFIVRRHPEPDTLNVETNFFALIEFSQVDFPWRFTPVRPSADSPNQLTPWLVLIVLKKNEFEGPKNGLILPEITIYDPSKSLPNISQTWAWAHCQIVGSVEDSDSLEEILANEPYRVISRLLTPRKLEPKKKYFAFLVPSFEVGRLASLGQIVPDHIKGTDPAWDCTLSESVTIGIYNTWEFTTGEEGDFEKLATDLIPRVLGENVGIRDLSLRNHGFTGIPILRKSLSLGGALLSKAANDIRKKLNVRTYEVENPGDDPPSYEEIKDFIDKMKKFIDIDELYKWSFVENGVLTDDDPIISLPKYGRWQAAKDLITRISSGSDNPEWISELNLPSKIIKGFKDNPPYKWFEDLNLDPTNRAVAGLGTTIMQRIQEEVMAAAWDQAGNIKKANEKLKWAQLSRTLSTNLYEKTFKNLEQDELLSIVSPIHKKLFIQEQTSTVKTLFQESSIPSAFLEPSFKKITRRRGKTHRKTFESNSNMHQNILHNFNKNPSNPNPNPATPDEFLTFDNSFPDLSIKEEDLSKDGFINPSFFKKLLIKIAQFCHRHKILYLIYLIVILILKWFYKYNNIQNYDEEQVNEFTPIAIQIEESIPAADSTIHEREGIILPLDQIYNTIIDGIHPKRVIEQKIQLEVNRPIRLFEDQKDLLEPNILSYFKIKRPMYNPLCELSQDLFLPGVEEIKDDTISILRTNPVFINSILAGVNYGASTEFLFREYPTDLRGTYSRQFWDPAIAVKREKLERLASLRQTDPEIQTLPFEIEEEIREKYLDIDEMHLWNDRTLDVSRGDIPKVHTVLIIKGELFRRYPRTIVFAVHGIVHSINGENIPVIPTLRNPDTEEYYYETKAENPNIKDPVFKGTIGTDIKFFGFDIPPDEVVGKLDELNSDDDAGWFFMLQDPPAEARFGVDEKRPDEGFNSWNDVYWDLFTLSGSKYIDVVQSNNHPDLKDKEFIYAPGVKWNTHAGNQAYITLQLPVQIAKHGSEMYSDDY